MADKYTFKIASVCSGGEHITVEVLRNGEKYKTRTLSREDIATGEYQKWENIMTLLIAKAIKHSGATTEEEYLKAINNMVITL